MASYRRRHWRSIVFVAVLTALLTLIFFLRSVLLPFLLGLVLADITLPVITWTEKHLPGKGKWLAAKRVLIIIFLFGLITGAFALLMFDLVSTIGGSYSTLINNASEYTSSALSQVQQWLRGVERELPPSVQQQMDQYIQDIGVLAGNAALEVIRRSVSVIPSTIGIILGFASLPLFLFYLLKDWEKLGAGLYGGMPPWAAKHARNVMNIIDDVMGRYFRFQIVLALIVGLMVLVGLLILRVQFAPMLAIFAAMTEVVPTVGPWIGGITAVIVTLATLPEKAIAVAILFAIVQITENALLVPRIQGAYLKMHPSLVVVLIVIGAYVAGFWGVVIAVPLTSTIVQIVRYFRQVSREEDQESHIV